MKRSIFKTLMLTFMSLMVSTHAFAGEENLLQVRLNFGLDREDAQKKLKKSSREEMIGVGNKLLSDHEFTHKEVVDLIAILVEDGKYENPNPNREMDENLVSDLINKMELTKIQLEILIFETLETSEYFPKLHEENVVNEYQFITPRTAARIKGSLRKYRLTERQKTSLVKDIMKKEKEEFEAGKRRAFTQAKLATEGRERQKAKNAGLAEVINNARRNMSGEVAAQLPLGIDRMSRTEKRSEMITRELQMMARMPKDSRQDATSRAAKRTKDIQSAFNDGWEDVPEQED